MRYPVILTKDGDAFVVTFPDVPEAITYGDTREEALARAGDALMTICDAFMKDRRDIPMPSETAGPAVEIPALETTKIWLYRTMQRANVGKAELARRLKWHLPQVDRVLNVRHGSQIDQIEAAFSALGKRLQVTIIDNEPEAHAGAHRVHGAIMANAKRARTASISATLGARTTSRVTAKRAAKKRPLATSPRR